jgi:hypothetical protein
MQLYLIFYPTEVVHVLWPSVLLSNGCFDVLDLTVVLVVLELLGAARDRARDT